MAVTDTILKKIAACNAFMPDLTFVAKTHAGKLITNPNVMLEYGYTPVTLLSFNGANGQYPYAGLIADAAGDLFATTHQGGPADGVGTVFEITGAGFIATDLWNNIGDWNLNATSLIA